MRIILKIILFPVTLVISIILKFLEYLLCVGAVVLNIFSIMFAVAGVLIFIFEKDYMFALQIFIAAFLLSPGGIPVIGATIIGFLGGINEMLKEI